MKTHFDKCCVEYIRGRWTEKGDPNFYIVGDSCLTCSKKVYLEKMSKAEANKFLEYYNVEKI